MGTLKLILAITTAKLISLLSKTFTKGGGTAAPGLYALKIDPQLIKKLSRSLTYGTIIVAGTNGKTTTTRMIAAILKESRISYIHNKEGSNLLRGLASVLVQKANFTNKPLADYALWEVDEATLPQLLLQVQPKIIVLTNLFRDQLDRYGEVASIRNSWKTTLSDLPANTTLILNADDPSIAHLGKEVKASVSYYGLDYGSQTDIVATSADANFCPVCNTELAYDKIYFSHIGVFHCPQCGFSRPPITYEACEIRADSKQTQFTLTTENRAPLYLHIPLPGTYNIYNALAAASGALALGLDANKIGSALNKFKSAFGRMETIQIKDKTIRLFLVKNPTGFNEVLHTLLQNNQSYGTIAMALNDNFADGTDVSWIWDVNFEQLQQHVNKVHITGTRRYDLAVRLKYAEIEQEVEDSLSTILENFLGNTSQQTLCYLPSYTAMLELRQYLVNQGYIKHYLHESDEEDN